LRKRALIRYLGNLGKESVAFIGMTRLNAILNDHPQLGSALLRQPIDPVFPSHPNATGAGSKCVL
jgi:hypothetical protein